MTQDFLPLEIERFMRVWQKQVEYDLGESGVHPISVRDLVLDPARVEELLDLELNYPHIAGDPELRDVSPPSTPEPRRTTCSSRWGPSRRII